MDSPKPYGQRSGWRPRQQEDFGDGGAFPEVPVAQYPRHMGRKTTSSSNALAISVDTNGLVQYDTIARQGHTETRTIHASFADLIPLRQRPDNGNLSLARPSPLEISASTKRTKDALDKLSQSNSLKAQKVSYNARNKHKRIPRGPPSPPAPQMTSPPRRITAEVQEQWKIPPPVSNWKNAKGYTIPLDKRLAADGRALKDLTINDKFAQFAEALFTADYHAREEVKQRATMQQKLAEKERIRKEEELRMLAQRAREERSGMGRRDSRRKSHSGSERRSSSASSRSDSDDEAARERERMRRERKQENEKKLRQSRMGTERRIQMMAREQNRDISEKVALGLAKPTQSSESMWDSRLFNQTSGFDTGINEDQPYDKPLFAAQEAISSIYRPRANDDDDVDEEAGAHEYERIHKSNRFEVLGKAKEGFKGATDAEAREGPVQFEKDTVKKPATDAADPFEIDAMIRDVTGGAGGNKRYGVQESGSRAPKRARVDEDEER